MPKRPGENLARTVDGSTYNKLQRPDNYPVEPARKLVANDNIVAKYVKDSHEVEYEEGDKEEEEQRDSDEEFAERSRKRKRIYNLKKNGMGTANGRLPLDDEDFSPSDLGDDTVSFAAIQYLKGVRAEADDLPVVSAAILGQTLSDEDHRGYYEDGAYVVAPELGPAYPDNYGEDYGEDYDYEGEETPADIANQFVRITPCEAYTYVLLSRYYQLRDSIRSSQASRSSSTEAQGAPLQVSSRGDLRRKEWQILKRTMNASPPQPSRLAATSIESILTLLSIIQKQCFPRKKNIGKNISLWILALLASIDERTIDSDITYDLRNFAKKAVWLRIDFEPRFAEASAAMAHEAGYLLEDELVADKAEAEEKLPEDEMLSDLLVDENVPDDMTKATLDMIITIVGEVFGQRDLLESRSVVDWPHMEAEEEEDVGSEIEDG